VLASAAVLLECGAGMLSKPPFAQDTLENTLSDPRDRRITPFHMHIWGGECMISWMGLYNSRKALFVLYLLCLWIYSTGFGNNVEVIWNRVLTKYGRHNNNPNSTRFDENQQDSLNFNDFHLNVSNARYFIYLVNILCIRVPHSFGNHVEIIWEPIYTNRKTTH